MWWPFAKTVGHLSGLNINMLVIENTGRVTDKDKVEFADRIMELRDKKDPWVVIDELVYYWIKSNPEEVEAVKIDVQDQRELLTDKKFGSTKGGKLMERRFKLLFPTSLMLMIRAVYPHEELKMDREFYDDFANRYPGFRVAEK